MGHKNQTIPFFPKFPHCSLDYPGLEVLYWVIFSLGYLLSVQLVAVYAQNGFVMLRFENYCTQPVELGPDGLPRRSSHGGYDLKSVRAAAEARGGTLTLHWENEWFTLRVLLPQK